LFFVAAEELLRQAKRDYNGYRLKY